MKIRFTCVTDSAIGEIISQATVLLEDKLNPIFEDLDFGADVSQFTVVAIVVQEVIAERFEAAHNKAGYFKHPITSERIRYISFAIPFNLSEISGMDEQSFSKLFADALIRRLDQPGVKIPKEFDYARFASTMRSALIDL